MSKPERYHLPECWLSEGKFDAVCLCDRLRACEQRVRVEQQVWHWRQGVQAAREAVAALPPSPLPERWGVRTAMNFRGDVLAAIDALRENKK